MFQLSSRSQIETSNFPNRSLRLTNLRCTTSEFRAGIPGDSKRMFLRQSTAKSSPGIGIYSRDSTILVSKSTSIAKPMSKATVRHCRFGKRKSRGDVPRTVRRDTSWLNAGMSKHLVSRILRVGTTSSSVGKDSEAERRSLQQMMSACKAHALRLMSSVAGVQFGGA